MTAINAHFYNQNEERPYPLSDAADLTTTDGRLLPHTIIADLNLKYPFYLGKYPFISSVCVTPGLVSVTVQAADSLSDSATFTPVAAVSLPQPVVNGIQYPVSGLVDGVGGWIVFGTGIQESFTGKFAGAGHGLLTARSARSYRPLPLSSLAKLNVTPLTGLVLLKAESPLTIVKEEHEIDDILRDVIVFRLVQSGNTAGTVNATNVMQQFAGPCGARPESGTCNDPQPIEFLNSVAPDCNGNITIELQGCATLSSVQQGSGVMIDCTLSLADACVPPNLPDSTGKLPGEGTNLCAPGEVSESIFHPVHYPPPPESQPFSESASESMPPNSLPYLDNFDAELIRHWTAVEGFWSFSTLDSPDDPTTPAYTGWGDFTSAEWAVLVAEDWFNFTVVPGNQASLVSSTATQTNIILWTDFDTEPLGRQYTTSLLMPSAVPVGAKHNAGFVLNYRPHPSYPGRFVYHLVLLNYDTQTLNIYRFNGTNLIPEPATASLPNLSLDQWYNLTALVQPGSGDSVQLTVTLTSLTGPTVGASLSLNTNFYLPAVGFCGFYADRAITNYAYFLAESV
jgi:hypothetical protein